VGLRRLAGGLVAFATATTLFALPPSAAAAGTLVAQWHMDETSGTTMVDSSGAGNNGTLSDVALGQPGVSGTAYSFNGVDSSVTVPDSSSLDPGSSNITFTVNVNFAAIPATDYDLLRKGLSNTNGGDYKVEILKKKSGTEAWASCFFGGSAAGKGVTFRQNLADSRWHSITCTKTSGSISVIVDGQTTTKSVTIGSIANSSPLWLGAKFKGTTPKDRYIGLMDEVSIQIG
jgi:hypothetical protein